MARTAVYYGTVVTLFLVCTFLLAGCTTTPGPGPSTPTPSPTPTTTPVPTPAPGDVKAVVDANNRFAFDLYGQLSRDPANAGKNIFFSPFSISSALAITYEGARTTTADEIRTVFHFPANTSTLRQGYVGINAGINRRDANFTLRTANALWAEKTYAFLPSYIATAERFYGANTTNLDFVTHPEESRVTINLWVEDRTNNLIKDLIPKGAIDAATRLVITNAIYFKGNWLLQFDKNKTADADFHVSSDKTVKVPMMEQSGDNAVFRYAENEHLQVLELPYANATGKGLSMVILLPKENDLSAAEKTLTPANITALRTSASSRRVDVYLPKFKLETGYSLPDTLTAMGMPSAFTGAADLSGMDGTRNLYISDVIHKAYVDVNEEGTEAAAATAVIIRETSLPIVPVFRADHPFLFLIQDNDSGAILFIGRVTDPSLS